MVGPTAAQDASRGRAFRFATALLVLALAGCVVLAVGQAHLDTVNALSAVLAVTAIAAGITVTPARGRASISASFIVCLLAAAVLGPTSACICAALAEFSAARRLRTPAFAVSFNLLGAIAPALAAANVIRAVAPSRGGASFYLVVAGAGLLMFALNFAIVAAYQQLYRGDGALSMQALRDLGPSVGLNILLAVAGVTIYLEVGLGGIVFALVAVFAFSYMAHLVVTAEHRAQQYRDLSWGVLAGLVRALDARDQRAARHSAAVARFARDLARATGMSERECELAHTAGLLHDIGRFALSDRVSERGRTLSEEDWEAIQRHPALGADMLRDLGVYGPVAEIVLTHHERVDGRGYPRALTRDEIPEIAKIIAVAEVYDTLTAQDTYRTRVSSFEALRELRRVAGTQLDARYVEAFAELLAGEGIDYRHADDASFDVELDIERGIKDAV
jgi:putative nucleotidyltransferase with HDIG domain